MKTATATATMRLRRSTEVLPLQETSRAQLLFHARGVSLARALALLWLLTASPAAPTPAAPPGAPATAPQSHSVAAAAPAAPATAALPAPAATRPAWPAA